jgi:hypothetical protein
MNEDIFSKMSSEPVKAVLAKKEEEMIYKGVFARTDPKLWFRIMPFADFETIPRAFIDDWTGVWVSLHDIQSFQICRHKQQSTESDSFPNCISFDGERLDVEKGVFFIHAPPLATIPMMKKEAETILQDPQKLRAWVGDILRNKKGQRLLIIFDPYDETIKIYNDNDLTKVETLRFQKAFVVEGLGSLYISHMPRLSEKIPYEFTKNIEIYNYKIVFHKDVVRFKIYARFGRAELIYNQNSEKVVATITYSQYEDYLFYLEPHKLYLFSERRPRFAQEEAEEEDKWFISIYSKQL